MEEFLFKKIEVWIVVLLGIFGVAGTVFFGAAVRYYHEGGNSGQFGAWADTIAAIPSTAKTIVKGKHGKAAMEAHEQRFDGHSGFVFNYQAGERPDLGYLLLNRYDFDLGMSVSELVDLNTQETLHRWHFDVDPLWKQSKRVNHLEVDHATKRFRNQHAYLLNNGSILTGVQGPLLSADLCSNLSLINDQASYHHSIERDDKGNFWIPKHFVPKTVKIGSKQFSDDGIALLTPDGKVLSEKSIISILDQNGLGYLIYGMGRYNDDPIHLNDIQPVRKDGLYWKTGDIFLSIRNLSMILLYRPSANQVLWYKQGPWIHQHDVNILDDHRISVFDNHARFEFDKSTENLVVDSSNNVYIFDFQSDSVTSPFQNAFTSLDIRTPTEGRGKIISSDEIFVEETNYGRLLQFNNRGEIIWQYINRASNGKVYYVSWSRLISRARGDRIRNAIKESQCYEN
ncbi:arylsulfotransferase family protein [Methylomicrobium agile]|uniref:arylsulfotransferase family protein n=1 Tax=Methylomicrobium agile TaxID=39774 RepID=UPI000AEBE8BC|nr:arylsulfotransferase family protein [Methylomicrobium agile]